MNRKVISLAIASALVVPLSPVVAQQAEETAGVIEEVTVTARKREESLQDIPISIAASEEQAARWQPLADELRFLFISGDVQVRPATTDEVFVSAQPTTKAKCVRCWHHRADVGSNADHPELCGRCVSNVTGAGEVRSWF